MLVDTSSINCAFLLAIGAARSAICAPDLFRASLDQMACRCPEAEVVGPVRLKDYKLAFRGSGFATILPCTGCSVEGMLWRVTETDEQRLDRYEGYPRHYGKHRVTVLGKDHARYTAMVYEMCPPMRDRPALPSQGYFNGILQGCRQNGLSDRPVWQALQETQAQMEEIFPPGTKRKAPKEAQR